MLYDRSCIIVYVYWTQFELNWESRASHHTREGHAQEQEVSVKMSGKLQHIS